MADEIGIGPKFVAEFIGTFFLLFVGAGSIILAAHVGALGSYPALLGIALAHGVALSVAVSAAMNISGGHINPAVSIAALAVGKIDGRTCGVYIVAQLAASVVAVALLFAAMPAPAVLEAQVGATVIVEGFPLAKALVLEAVLTFMLVLAIWGTAISRHAPKIGGFGIGLTVFFDILVGGPLTGASMNPARSFGPNLAAGLLDASFAVFWIAPVIGGLVAALVYEYGIERVIGEAEAV